VVFPAPLMTTIQELGSFFAREAKTEFPASSIARATPAIEPSSTGQASTKPL